MTYTTEMSATVSRPSAALPSNLCFSQSDFPALRLLTSAEALADRMAISFRYAGSSGPSILLNRLRCMWAAEAGGSTREATRCTGLLHASKYAALSQQLNIQSSIRFADHPRKAAATVCGEERATRAVSTNFAVRRIANLAGLSRVLALLPNLLCVTLTCPLVSSATSSHATELVEIANWLLAYPAESASI